MEVIEQVVGMETSAPAVTHSPVGYDTSKHGDGTQSEAAQKEDLSLPMEPNEGGGVIELPVESPAVLSPKGTAEGTAAAQKKRKNWGQKDTDDLMVALLNTPKVCTRMEQGTASGPYWDAIAKVVPGRTGDECRGRVDTLKKSYSKTKKYCDEQGKEFKQLNEDDFGKLTGSPQLTEAWFNQIHDSCPPRPKKKLKTNGAGSSPKRSGFASDSSTSGLQPCVFPDGIGLGEPAFVDPPASQLELSVADPIQQEAPPAAPPCSDFTEDPDEASSLDLPVVDPLEQQAPPASPHWSDYIDYFPVTVLPIEQAIAAPSLPRCDSIEELGHEAWKSLDSSEFVLME